MHSLASLQIQNYLTRSAAWPVRWHRLRVAPRFLMSSFRSLQWQRWGRAAFVPRSYLSQWQKIINCVCQIPVEDRKCTLQVRFNGVHWWLVTVRKALVAVSGRYTPIVSTIKLSFTMDCVKTLILTSTWHLTVKGSKFSSWIANNVAAIGKNQIDSDVRCCSVMSRAVLKNLKGKLFSEVPDCFRVWGHQKVRIQILHNNFVTKVTTRLLFVCIGILSGL